MILYNWATNLPHAI